MNDSAHARKFRRIVVYSLSTAFFAVLLLFLVYGIRPMILPFVLGAFLAYLFKPLARSFRGSSLLKYFRVGAMLAIIGVLIYSGVNFVISSLPNDAEVLQIKVRIQYRLSQRYQSWMGLDKNVAGNFLYKTFGRELDLAKQKTLHFVRLNADEKKSFLKLHNSNSDLISQKYYEYYLANLKTQNVDIEKLKTSSALSTPTSEDSTAVVASSEPNSLANLISALSHWIIMPLAFIFILLDRGQIIHFILRLVPNRYFELSHSIFENVDEALGKYIRGTMLECTLVGLTLMFGLYLCGFELKVAVIIGLIGGITNAIPFVGTLLACAIAATYSLITENAQPLLPFITDDNLMIAAIAVVIITHLLDNAIYQPLVVGSAVNIHPLVVIIGVFGGSLLFGFAGLIFAIPAIVILKVVTETFFSGLKDYRII